jgi:hypothetical protein
MGYVHQSSSGISSTNRISVSAWFNIPAASFGSGKVCFIIDFGYNPVITLSGGGPSWIGPSTINSFVLIAPDVLGSSIYTIFGGSPYSYTFNDTSDPVHNNGAMFSGNVQNQIQYGSSDNGILTTPNTWHILQMAINTSLATTYNFVLDGSTIPTIVSYNTLQLFIDGMDFSPNSINGNPFYSGGSPLPNGGIGTMFASGAEGQAVFQPGLGFQGFTGHYDEARWAYIDPGYWGIEGDPPPPNYANSGNSGSVSIAGWNIPVSGYELGVPANSIDAAGGSSNNTNFGNSAAVRMAEFQAWFGTFIDFSNPVNRAKFITNTGKPVDPAIAAAAFGTQTILLRRNKTLGLHFDTNEGIGGSFTSVGTITDFTPGPF